MFYTCEKEADAENTAHPLLLCSEQMGGGYCAVVENKLKVVNIFGFLTNLDINGS